LEADGSNPIVQQVVTVYLTFLQIGQSEGLFRHVFASLRALLNNYSAILFQGNVNNIDYGMNKLFVDILNFIL
jgi:hypothetical protein